MANFMSKLSKEIIKTISDYEHRDSGMMSLFYVQETVNHILKLQKEIFADDLKRMFNKCKTERGLSVALSNYIKKL